MNAFGAALQEEEDGDYLVLSSYLGIIVSKNHITDRGYGTLEGHLMAACTSGTPYEILTRPRWIIPLCGGNPLHWVLGWVDLGRKEIGIFDSLPQLHSESWAQPLLCDIINAIFRSQSVEEIPSKISPWNKVLASPPPLQRQMDAWSCGLFTMMAMQAYALRHSFDLVGHDQKDAIRQKAFKMLINLPVIRGGDHSSAKEPTISSSTLDMGQPPESVSHSTHSELDINKMTSQEPSSQLPPSSECHNVTAKREESKRKYCSDTDENKTDNEQSIKKRQITGSGSRAPQRKEAEHRKGLEGDSCYTHVHDMETKNGSDTKPSAQITGTEKKRVRHVSEPGQNNPPAGCSSIAAYFPLISQKSRQQNIASHSETSAQKVSYTAKVTKRTRSVADFFAPKSQLADMQAKSGETPSPPKSTALSPTTLESKLEICRQIRGEKYDEYIMRIRTRTLGGISPEFRAHAERCLFPYKPFIPLKESRKDLPAITPTKDLKETNEEIKEQNWTAAEKQAFDQVLRAHARWEVDYANGVVSSIRCEGRTNAPDQICMACREVMRDESFKRAIRRKEAESKLAPSIQHEKHVAREKFTPYNLSSSDSRTLDAKLKDPLVFKTFQHLQRGNDSTNCFLALYKAGQEGKLENKQTIIDLCSVFEDQLRRQTSSNANLKYGIRYSENYRNFMILMRGRNGNSARQYSILQSQIGGPTPRTLRALVAKSEDALTNPLLIFENVALTCTNPDSCKYMVCAQ
ncbi:hypothetical protein BJ138DRAFT_1120733 [Hygrophoropsis aurantiaca]|uniref:Uncharacterized protein n=1 Tax=Hygrophoropsis aurantiaca TaxID=72124 RepID=A0ACB7ZQX8_9AGAM|nr:hypothetical protein BJ138DRAFT_1120733 [Hygrophoropsis aurantiaca]